MSFTFQDTTVTHFLINGYYSVGSGKAEAVFAAWFDEEMDKSHYTSKGFWEIVLFFTLTVKVLKINHIRNNHRNRWLTGLMRNAAQSWRQHVDDTDHDIWWDILIFHSMPLLSTCCPRNIKEQSLISSQQMLKTWMVPRKPSERVYCLPYPSVCQASRGDTCALFTEGDTRTWKKHHSCKWTNSMNVKLFSLRIAWNYIKQIYWKV